MSKKNDVQQSENDLVHDGEETSVLQGMSTTSSSQEGGLQDADQIDMKTYEDPPQGITSENLETPLIGQNETPTGLRSRSNSLFTFLRRFSSVIPAHISEIQRMNTFYQSALRQRMAKQRGTQPPSEQKSFEKAGIEIRNRIRESDLLLGELKSFLQVDGDSATNVDTPTAPVAPKVNLGEAFEILIAERVEGSISDDEISALEDMLRDYKRTYPSTISDERAPVVAYWSELRRLFSLPPAFAEIASKEELIFASAASAAYEWLCCRNARGPMVLILRSVEKDTEISQKLVPALCESFNQSSSQALMNALDGFIALSESIISAGNVDKDDSEVLRKDGSNQDDVRCNVQIGSLKQEFAVKTRNIQGWMRALSSTHIGTKVLDKNLGAMFAIVQQLHTLGEPQKPPILTSNLVDSTEADMSEVTFELPLTVLPLRLPYPAQHYMLRDILDSFKHVMFEHLQPRVRDAMELHGWHFPESITILAIVKALDNEYPLAKLSSSDPLFKLMAQIRTRCDYLREHQREWKSLKILRNATAHAYNMGIHDLMKALADMITLGHVFDAKLLIERLEQYQQDLKNFAIQHLQRQRSLRKTALIRLEAIAQKRRELEQGERGVLADLHRQDRKYSVEYATTILERGRGASSPSDAAKILERGRGVSSPSDAAPAKWLPQESMQELRLRHVRERKRLALMLKSRDTMHGVTAAIGAQTMSSPHARAKAARPRRRSRSESRSASKSRPNNEPVRLEETRGFSQETPNPPAPEDTPKTLKEAMRYPSKGTAHPTAKLMVRRITVKPFESIGVRRIASFQSPDEVPYSAEYKLLRRQLQSTSDSTASYTTAQGTGRPSLPSRPLKSTHSLKGRLREKQRRRLGIWPDKKVEPYTPHTVDDAIERFAEGRATAE